MSLFVKRKDGGIDCPVVGIGDTLSYVVLL